MPASVHHTPGALPRTRSAPSSPRLPAAGELGGEEDRHQTAGPLRSPPDTPRRGHARPTGRMGSPGRGCGAAEEEAENGEHWLKEMRGSLLVVASLLASVTYQAGTNPPGGLWQDTSPAGSPNPHRAGDPVLQDTDSARFQLFNLFNSFAFAYSVGAMMQLITESLITGWRGGPRRVRTLLGFGSVRTMKYMMTLSLLYLSVAFAAGSCRNWWCSLGFVASPLLYFLSCVAFDLLYSMFRRRQEKKRLAPAPAEQVEVDVEHHSHHAAGHGLAS